MWLSAFQDGKEMWLVAFQDGKETCVTGKQLFAKVIVPLWLKELKAALPAPPAAPPRAAEEPPRKKAKNRSALNEAMERRRAVIGSLSSDMFLPVEALRADRRGSAKASFSWFRTATKQAEKTAKEDVWAAAGKADLFPLFHPGSNKPFNIKQCAPMC